MEVTFLPVQQNPFLFRIHIYISIRNENAPIIGNVNAP